MRVVEECIAVKYFASQSNIVERTGLDEISYLLAGASSTIACTSWSMVSVIRFGGRLELLDRIENATTSPLSVVAYPESVFTPPSDPVLARTRLCSRGAFSRSESDPSMPETGNVDLYAAPHGCVEA